MTEKELKSEIERHIDATNLSETLYLIEEICMAKADHISANWQDEKLATKWVSASNAVNGCRGQINLLLL